jgi:hypothetical protein
MAGVVNNLMERKRAEELNSQIEDTPNLEDTDKSFYERVWPVLACGAGLFSDGYLNGVSSKISTI